MIQQLDKPDPAYVTTEGIRLLQLQLKPDALRAILAYIDLLLQWPDRARLTALNDPIKMATFHVLDSLAVFKVLAPDHGFRVLDVGTGAGFPGMVMGIADSRLEVTLMDRDVRKIVFLKYAVKELGVPRVKFLNVALKKLLVSPPETCFDVIVSRAFSSNPTLLNSLSSLLCTRGSLIRMAGPASLRQEFLLNNFRLAEVWEGILPFSNRFRRVLRYTLTHGD